MAEPSPEDVREAYHEGTLIGIERVLAFIESRSVPRTPMRTGYLRSSVYTETEQDHEGRVPQQGDMTEGEIGYTADYAVYQHEALDWKHDEGQAKFLEASLLEAIPEAPRIIGEAIDEKVEALFA